MIAVARVSVNHDGRSGTAPDPLVWDQGSRPKVRKLAIRVNVDLASLPGPPVSFLKKEKKKPLNRSSSEMYACTRR